MGPAATLHPLPSGLTVVHQFLPEVAVVAADVWVKVGATAEPASWYGIAHFLEHLVFQGTATLAPGQFDARLEGCGAQCHGATGHDYTHYALVAAADCFAQVLPLLADSLLHASLEPALVEAERAVILAELEQASQDPDWQVYHALRHQVYGNHAYGRSVLGSRASIMALATPQLAKFHRCYYTPAGMVLAIVGGIALEETLAMVETAFADARPMEPAPKPAQAVAERTQRRWQNRCRGLTHARLLMGWQGPGCHSLGQACGLDLLASVLAERPSSPLVRELQHRRGWVYHIRSSFSLQQQGGLFTIAADLDPKYLGVVEMAIRDCLHGLAQTPLDGQELHRHQHLLGNEYIFASESASQRANLYGYYAAMGQPRAAMAYPEEIDAWQPDQLQALAAQYLSPTDYSIATLLPA